MMRILVTTCILAICCGQAKAQTPAAAPTSSGTRVGVVDLDVVYPKYKRFLEFKAELEREAQPFLKKTVELEKLIEEWRKFLNKLDSEPETELELDGRRIVVHGLHGLPAEEREKGKRIIVEAMRRLEDLDYEWKKLFAKKFESQIEAQEKEISECINGYAVAHGLDVVFIRGEHPVQKLTPSFRRLLVVLNEWKVVFPTGDAKAAPKAMPEMNNLRPAYVSGNADLSLRIVEILNDRHLRSRDNSDGDDEE